MEGTNWSSAPGEPALARNGSTADWRSQLQPEARQRIVNKILDTLKRHLPISAPEGVSELQKIAIRFEEKIYSAAANQSDYLRKISLKMLTMEHKPQHNGPMNPSMPNSTVIYQNSADPVNQSSRQQGLPQNIQSNSSIVAQSPPSALLLTCYKKRNKITVLGPTCDIENLGFYAKMQK